MERLFHRDVVLAEQLGVNEHPKKKFHVCPYCQTPLANAYDNFTLFGHDRSLDYGFCLRCGWWDVIYREDDVNGDAEEDSYYHCTLKNLDIPESIEFALSTAINELAQQPERIYDIAPRRLEEIIAHLFRNTLNCSVELTKTTRDGGKDIVCIDSNFGKFVVEIKRYRRSRKIGVAYIRHLLGVMLIEGYEYGVFVTTSDFTKDALKAQAQLSRMGKWRIDLRDFDDIKNWLNLSYRQYFDPVILNASLSKVLGYIVAPGVQFPRKFITVDGATIEL